MSAHNEVMEPIDLWILVVMTITLLTVSIILLISGNRANESLANLTKDTTRLEQAFSQDQN